MQLFLAGPYRQLSNLFASSSSVSSLVRTSYVPVSVHRILRTGFLQYFLLNIQALYMNNKPMLSALYSDGSLVYGSTLQLDKSSHMGWFINLSCFEQIHCNIIVYIERSDIGLFFSVCIRLQRKRIPLWMEWPGLLIKVSLL